MRSLTILLLCLISPSIFSTTIRVPTDQPSIGEAVAVAASGDTVLVADGVYTGENNRDIDFGGKSLVLLSENGPEFTTIDCEGQGRAVYLHSGEDSTTVINGFTITRGRIYKGEGAGILCDSASLAISNCLFSRNKAGFGMDGMYGHGGAIAFLNSSGVVQNCRFTDNSNVNINCDALGGAIYTAQSDVTITGSLFFGNRACSGSAISCDWNSSLIVSECTFYGNTATYLGVIELWWECSIVIERSIFAVNVGGGVLGFRDSSSSYSVECCNFFNNSGCDYGDCLQDEVGFNGNISANPFFCNPADSSLEIIDISLCAPDNSPCGDLIGSQPVGCFVEYKNWYVTSDGSGDAPTIQAAVDSAIHLDTLTLAAGIYAGQGNRGIEFKGKSVLLRPESGIESVIIDCENLDRGFVFSEGEDSTTVIEGIVIRNGIDSVGNSGGGAVQIKNNSRPFFRNCSFKSNRAYTGGAINCDSYCSPSFLNCVFDGNVATFEGGAFDGIGSGATFDSCLFVNNEAQYGSAYQCFWCEPVFTNCTFANNRCLERSGTIKNWFKSGRYENCLIAYNQGYGINIEEVTDSSITCTDIVGNSEGDWVGTIDTLLGINGNISEPPLFCDRDSGDYRISTYSPCAPANNECNALIGAFDVGCIGCCNLRGDFDHSYAVDIADLTGLVAYIFQNGPSAPCEAEVDLDLSGGLDIGDLTALVDFLFLGGPVPPPCEI